MSALDCQARRFYSEMSGRCRGGIALNLGGVLLKRENAVLISAFEDDGGPGVT